MLKEEPKVNIQILGKPYKTQSLDDYGISFINSILESFKAGLYGKFHIFDIFDFVRSKNPMRFFQNIEEGKETSFESVELKRSKWFK